MSTPDKLYIAGIGMITSVGANTAMTAASVKAGISGYGVSGYYDDNNNPITMACVPNKIFDTVDADIDKGNRFNERHDRVTKMAITAAREACENMTSNKPVPLILAMPEERQDEEGLPPLINALEKNCAPFIRKSHYHTIEAGRAAGIEAISLAFSYFNDPHNDYILIGGSDSFLDYERLAPLMKKNRLLTEKNTDGFAPGEGACFLLLTSKPELATVKTNHCIALYRPGIANEDGHLNSSKPYRGEGLDRAFKKATKNCETKSIHVIYSSMNGENHWAKELGVACIRNKAVLNETLKIEHPADIYGDVGSATGATLIALAAEDLHKNKLIKSCLVYSASDTAKSGGVVIEKLVAVALDTRSTSYA